MINKNINSYINAIYELSLEDNFIERYYFLSNKLLEVNQEVNFAGYLSDYRIELKDKEDFLTSILVEEQDLYYKNWLILLIKNNLIKKFDAILQKLLEKYNEYQKIAFGTVWTTLKINDQKIKILEEKFSKVLDKKVSLVNQIDQEILGGIKVSIDGRIWDNTVLYQIKNLSKNLIERKIGE